MHVNNTDKVVLITAISLSFHSLPVASSSSIFSVSNDGIWLVIDFSGAIGRAELKIILAGLI